jgi:hypothetical protein
MPDVADLAKLSYVVLPEVTTLFVFSLFVFSAAFLTWWKTPEAGFLFLCINLQLERNERTADNRIQT